MIYLHKYNIYKYNCNISNIVKANCIYIRKIIVKLIDIYSININIREILK